MNKITENKNSGFSLVELIVVIAIMAVLTSVLAPSLLSYVEKSRMQKDDSAMGEVANSIKLALADQNVYDECLTYNVRGNYSCYVDDGDGNDALSAASTSKVIIDKETKTADKSDWQWHSDDTTRLADEKAYTPSGYMRGMTLTFTAGGGSNTAEFKMKDARVNEIVAGDDDKWGDEPTARADALTLNKMKSTGGQEGQLYNKLRAQIGDSITLSSQTYRNSEYTVFIRMGSMGGNDASAQDAVAVYGQWSGTNLPATAPTTTP